MHKVSRTLLLVGVVAFGTLTAACGDKVTVTSVTPVTGVQSVTVTPANATIPAGTTIQLSASVLADAATAKTVSWTTSNAGVATVDQTGKVTGTALGGTVTIIATSTADASKSGASAVVVTPAPVVAPPTLPTISIGSVNTTTAVGSVPVNLSNVAGQIDVTVNTTGGGTVNLYISPAANCATNTIAANDKLVTSQITTAQSGAVILSYNTATLTGSPAITPAFINGNYCIKASLVAPSGTVVATNTAPIVLNNVSFYKATTLAFAIPTGSTLVGTASVSSINGLNYNAGTLTATITPINYNSGSPVSLISGTLSRNGELNGAGVAPISFTNVAVSSTTGQATIVFTDTSLAGVNSIFKYTSPSAGDAITIASATDAAGNPFIANGTVATGIRIDNDSPTLGTATFAVTPGVNGYIGAGYSFASGTTGGATVVDTKIAIDGVGGVTRLYYSGDATLAAFATANSCNITGLTLSTNGSDLANQVVNTFYRSKVVVADKLGNQTCLDIVGQFGVDKIVPLLSLSAAGAANNTGYNSRATNFVYTFSDTISGFNPLAPLQVTLIRNGTSPSNAFSGLVGDCVIGVYSVANKTCKVAPSTGTFSIGDAASTNGYYTATSNSIDQAAPGNTSLVVTTVIALDSIIPTLASVGQSPAAILVAGSGTVTATAADNLNLISARGNLFYAGAIPFTRATQTLGSFGGNLTSAPVSLTLPTPVYTGMQITAAGVIQAGGTVPQDSLQAIDVGGGLSVWAINTLTTAATKADTLVGFSLVLNSSVAGAPATTQASTNLSVVLTGTTTNLPNQPFTSVDFYKLTSGRLVLVGSQALGAVTDTPASVRTWSFLLNVPLTAAATNTFYAVARNSSGNGIQTALVSIVNP